MEQVVRNEDMVKMCTSKNKYVEKTEAGTTRRKRRTKKNGRGGSQSRGQGKKPIMVKTKQKVMYEVIKKVGNKYVLYPKKGGKRLGTHDTKKVSRNQESAAIVSMNI